MPEDKSIIGVLGTIADTVNSDKDTKARARLAKRTSPAPAKKLEFSFSDPLQGVDLDKSFKKASDPGRAFLKPERQAAAQPEELPHEIKNLGFGFDQVPDPMSLNDALGNIASSLNIGKGEAYGAPGDPGRAFLKEDNVPTKTDTAIHDSTSVAGVLARYDLIKHGYVTKGFVSDPEREQLRRKLLSYMADSGLDHVHPGMAEDVLRQAASKYKPSEGFAQVLAGVDSQIASRPLPSSGTMAQSQTVTPHSEAEARELEKYGTGTNRGLVGEGVSPLLHSVGEGLYQATKLTNPAFHSEALQNMVDQGDTLGIQDVLPAYQKAWKGVDDTESGRILRFVTGVAPYFIPVVGHAGFVEGLATGASQGATEGQEWYPGGGKKTGVEGALAGAVNGYFPTSEIWKIGDPNADWVDKTIGVLSLGLGGAAAFHAGEGIVKAVDGRVSAVKDFVTERKATAEIKSKVPDISDADAKYVAKVYVKTKKLYREVVDNMFVNAKRFSAEKLNGAINDLKSHIEEHRPLMEDLFDRFTSRFTRGQTELPAKPGQTAEPTSPATGPIAPEPPVTPDTPASRTPEQLARDLGADGEVTIFKHEGGTDLSFVQRLLATGEYQAEQTPTGDLRVYRVAPAAQPDQQSEPQVQPEQESTPAEPEKTAGQNNVTEDLPAKEGTKFEVDEELVSTSPDGKQQLKVSYRGPGQPGYSVVVDEKGMQFQVKNEQLSRPKAATSETTPEAEQPKEETKPASGEGVGRTGQITWPDGVNISHQDEGGHVGEASPLAIHVKKGIQYKEGVTDEESQTTAKFKGVQTFNPEQAGEILAWHTKDGKLFVVHGHHRLEMAKRAPKVAIDAPGGGMKQVPRRVKVRVLREEEGWTLKDVRVRGAIENLRNGDGTAFDAAKVLKELGLKPSDLPNYGIQVKGHMQRDTAGLMRLSDTALDLVRRKIVPEPVAAGIGSVEGIPEDMHAKAIVSAEKAGVRTYDEGVNFGTIFKQGLVNAGAKQGGFDDMFGGELEPGHIDTTEEQFAIQNAVSREILANWDLYKKGMKFQTVTENEFVDVEAREEYIKQFGAKKAEVAESLGYFFDGRHKDVTDLRAELAKQMVEGTIDQEQAVEKLKEAVLEKFQLPYKERVSPTRRQQEPSRNPEVDRGPGSQRKEDEDRTVPSEEPESGKSPEPVAQQEEADLAEPVTEDAAGGALDILKNALDQGLINESKTDYGSPRLFATHNLTIEGLRVVLKRGGVPVPSLAVMREGDPGNTDYGDVSLFAGKDVIDPSISGNRVFSADAWTPVEPSIHHEVDKRAASDVLSAAQKAAGVYHYDSALDALDKGKHGAAPLNRPTFVAHAKTSRFLKTLYLEEKGVKFKVPYREKRPESLLAHSPQWKEIRAEILERSGGDSWRLLRELNDNRDDPLSVKLVAAVKDVAKQSYSSAFSKKELDNIVKDIPGSYEWGRIERDVYNFGKKELDESAWGKRVDGLVKKNGGEKAYADWVEKQADRIYHTPHLLHGRQKLEPTLENTFRIMASKPARGDQGGFMMTPAQIAARLSERLTTLGKVRSTAKEKIVSNEADREAEHAKTSARMADWVMNVGETWPTGNPFIDSGRVMDAVAEAIGKGGAVPTRSRLKRVLESWSLRPTEAMVDEGMEILHALRSSPAEYLEAKPARIVRLEDFKAALLPKSAPKDIVKSLKAAGLKVEFYDGREDRAAKASKLASEAPGAMFETPTGYGGLAKTFFSKLEQAAATKLPNKGTPEQFKATLLANGVKAEEMEYSGVGALLDGRKITVTKQDVLDTLAVNQIEVREVLKGEKDPDDYTVEDEMDQSDTGPTTTRYNHPDLSLPGGSNYRELLLTLPPKDVWETRYQVGGDPIIHADFATRAEAQAHIDSFIEKMADWPTELRKAQEWRFKQYPPFINEYTRRVGEQKDFRSSHWEEPNVLLHVRFDDRPSKLNYDTATIRDIESRIVDALNKDNSLLRTSGHTFTPENLASGAVGRAVRLGAITETEGAKYSHFRQFNNDTTGAADKTLHIAEIQSDWHQAGREQGYVGKGPANLAARDTGGGYWEVTDRDTGNFVTNVYRTSAETEPEAIAEAHRRLRDNPESTSRGHEVPDAPFKKTWHELAFKRMIRYAAENGYDKITWDTGATNAERYDLSKQVDRIDYNEEDGLFNFSAVKNGREVVSKENLTPKELEAHVGKELAQKMVNGEGTIGSTPDDQDYKSLTGIDLKVGGKGMEGFYDHMLPSFVNKYVKRWGARVEPDVVPSRTKRVFTAPDRPLSDVKARLADIRDKWTGPNQTQEGWRNWNVSLDKQADKVIGEMALGATYSDAVTAHGSEGLARMMALGGKFKDVPELAPVHSLKITPAMREEVLKQGQALFEAKQKYQPLKQGPELVAKAVEKWQGETAMKIGARRLGAGLFAFPNTPEGKSHISQLGMTVDRAATREENLRWAKREGIGEGTDSGLFDATTGTKATRVEPKDEPVQETLFESKPLQYTITWDGVEHSHEVRKGTNEIQRENARQLVKGLHGTKATVLARAFGEMVAKEGGASLVGLPLESHADLASAAQILRDYRWETFRIVLVKDRKIVNVVSMSNRLPGMTAVVPKGEPHFGAYLDRIITDNDADSFYVLHNHPSGDPTPSPEDVRLTTFLGTEKVFKGHVVIDDNKYAFINPAGQVSQAKIKSPAYPASSAPHKVIGGEILDEGAVVSVGKHFEKPEHVVFIGVDSKAKTRIVFSVPTGELPKFFGGMRGAARLSRIRRQNGLGSLYMVFADPSSAGAHLSRLSELQKLGLLEDFIVDTPAGPVGLRDPYYSNDRMVMGRELGDSVSANIVAEGSRDITQTPEFKRWFGDSKVVDESGKPIVVYHGTDSHFDTFKPEMLGRSTDAASAKMGFWFTDSGKVASGYSDYAAQDAHVQRAIKKAETLERQGRWDEYNDAVIAYEKLDEERRDRLAGQQVIPAFLRLENPAVMDAGGEYFTAIDDEIRSFLRQAKRDGKDGAIIQNLDDSPGNTGDVANHYVVFDPKQVKSAIGNQGTFDPESPSIVREPAADYGNLPQNIKDALRTRLRFHLQNGANDIDTLVARMRNDAGSVGESFARDWWASSEARQARLSQGNILEGASTDAKTTASKDSDNATGSDQTDGGPDAGVPGRQSEGRPKLRVVDEEVLRNLSYDRKLTDGSDFPAGALDEHQLLAANLIVQRWFDKGRGFLLADGPGVGKTREILAAVAYIQKVSGKPALIVTKNKQIVETAFKKDALALKVDLSKIETGTYDDLRTNKIGLRDYSVAAYDEAHGFKNEESQRTQQFRNVKTDTNLYATATPMDRPESAAYFFADLLDRTVESVMAEIGITYRVEHLKDGDVRTWIQLTSGNTWDTVKDHILAMRQQAIEKGAMVRREYPYWGELSHVHWEMDPRHYDEQSQIEAYWDDVIAGARHPDAKRNYAGQKTLELSRWAEAQKIPATIKRVTDALQAGFKPVIVAEGVNESVVKGLGGETVPGALSTIRDHFENQGYRVAQIFGDGDKSEAVKLFQSGIADIALMTPQSGGTGVDLDDQVGDAPREPVFMTVNFAGDQFDQSLFRFSRRNSKSPANAEFLVNTDLYSDRRRWAIVKQKFSALKAVQTGEDVDFAQMFGYGESDNNGRPPKEPARLVKLDVPLKTWGREFTHKVAGDSYAVKDLLKAAGATWIGKEKGWFVEPNRVERVQTALGGDESDGGKPLQSRAEEPDKAKTQTFERQLRDLVNIGKAIGVQTHKGAVRKSKAAGDYTPPSPRAWFGKIRTKNRSESSFLAEVVAHELAHAINAVVLAGREGPKKLGFHKKHGRPEVVFDWIDADTAKVVMAEWEAVTRELEGDKAVDADPNYFLDPREMFARFMQSAIFHPGILELYAPHSDALLTELAKRNPVVFDYMQVAQGVALENGSPIAVPDRRQRFIKDFGRYVGTKAYGEEVVLRSRRAKAVSDAKALVEGRFKEAYGKNWRKATEELERWFDAAEGILTVVNGHVVFGTRIVRKLDPASKTFEEERDFFENDGFVNVASTNEDGSGWKAVFVKWRKSPEEAKRLFQSLSPEGQKILKEYASDIGEAKDLFNREALQQFSEVASNVEGYIRHLFPKDKKSPFGNIGGSKLRERKGGFRKQRTEAEGYEKDPAKAIQHRMVEAVNEKEWNRFVHKQVAMLAEPLADGEKPRDGWVEVVGNPKMGYRLSSDLLMMVDGRKVSPKRYQIPDWAYKDYVQRQLLARREEPVQTMLLSLTKYMTSTLLVHPGTAFTNFASGGLTWALYTTRQFYTDLLEGDFAVPRWRNAVMGTIETFTPEGWKKAPDWVFGGSDSTFWHQFRQTDSTEGPLQKSVDTLLTGYQAIERFFKKAITNSEARNAGLEEPEQLDQHEFLQAVADVLDLYTLDYLNAPEWLEHWRKSPIGSGVKPFVTYVYKMLKQHSRFVNEAFDPDVPPKDRLAALLAIGTLFTLYTLYKAFKDQGRETQKTPTDAPGNYNQENIKGGQRVRPGAVYLGTDENGDEIFVDVSKYQVLWFFEWIHSLAQGKVGDSMSILGSQIGQLGPGGEALMTALGYSDEFSKFDKPEVRWAKSLEPLVPFHRIVTDVGNIDDPLNREYPDSFKEEIQSKTPGLRKELDERTVKVPLPPGEKDGNRTTETLPVPKNRADALARFLFGVNVRRVNRDWWERMTARESENAAKRADKESDEE